jgi:hypothetical protein
MQHHLEQQPWEQQQGKSSSNEEAMAAEAMWHPL